MLLNLSSMVDFSTDVLNDSSQADVKWVDSSISMSVVAVDDAGEENSLRWSGNLSTSGDDVISGSRKVFGPSERIFFTCVIDGNDGIRDTGVDAFDVGLR